MNALLLKIDWAGIRPLRWTNAERSFDFLLGIHWGSVSGCALKSHVYKLEVFTSMNYCFLFLNSLILNCISSVS